MGKQSVDKRNRQNRMMIGISAAVAFFVVVLILWSVVSRSDFLKYGKKAFQVGEESYTVAEVNYYYYTAYDAILQNMQGYVNMAGLDISQDLSTQDCPIAEEPMSWRDYLLKQATERLGENSMLYQEAAKNGYQVDEAMQTKIEQVLKNRTEDMNISSREYRNLSHYLKMTYGGIEEEGLRKLLEQQYMAEAYKEAWKADCTFSEEELYGHYQEHQYEYNTYSYLYAYVGNQQEVTEELIKTQTEESFRETTKRVLGSDCYEILDVPGSQLGDGTTEDLMWIADKSRKSGDTYLGKSGEDFYVLCYLGSDDNGFSTGDEHWKMVATAGMKEEKSEEWKEGLIKAYKWREYSGMKIVGCR